MADELDQMLQGAEEQSPASQAQTGVPTPEVQPLATPTPEEVEFNNLAGSTQERIRQLIREKNEALAAAQAPAYVPPTPAYVPPAPDVQDAVRRLSEVGIATKEDVNRTLDEKLNQVRWENEMNKLSSTYDGKDGTPQFDRLEVEDYIRTHPQFMGYAPEDVFKFKMFPEEFSAGAVKPKKSTSLRPTKQVTQENAMTVEYIAERTDIKKYPDAREWQDEHKAEIDKVLSNMG